MVKPRGYLQEAVLRRMTPLQAWDAWLFIAVNHLPHTKLTNTLMHTLTAVTIGGAAWYAGTIYAWLRGARGGRLHRPRWLRRAQPPPPQLEPRALSPSKGPAPAARGHHAAGGFHGLRHLHRSSNPGP